MASFAVGAAVNWSWEIGVLPMLALLLGAVALAAGRTQPRVSPPHPTRRLPRAATGIVAVVAIAVIAIPLASTVTLRDSQAQARNGDLAGALRSAGQARALQPYAAAPRLQQALVFEGAGNLDPAARSAAEAVSRSPNDWRLWLVRSRIEARRGNAGASLAAYRRARSLNPRSGLFAR